MSEDTEIGGAGGNWEWWVYRRLVAAMVLVAMHEALKGDGVSLVWLYSDDCAQWCDLAGLDRSWLLRRLNRCLTSL